MKKYILALFVTILLPFTPPVAHAQIEALLPSATQNTAEQSSVKQEDIKKLINTLQSDTDRKDLINNLQILLDEQAKKETTPEDEILPTLTEQLGIRNQISGAVKEYENIF